MLVDADKQTQSPAFDQARLVISLGNAMEEPITAQSLPFERVHLGGRAAMLEHNNDQWRCDLAAYTCAKLPASNEHRPTPDDGGYDCTPPPANSSAQNILSPNGKWLAFVINYNIALRPVTAKADDPKTLIMLSEDGSEGNYYSVHSSGRLIRNTSSPAASVQAIGGSSITLSPRLPISSSPSTRRWSIRSRETCFRFISRCSFKSIPGRNSR